MTFAILLSLAFADPPPEVPSLETVRKAFKANIDRMANRRVKYVRVALKGEPTLEFPPLDHPDRGQIEEVLSKGETPSAARYFVRWSTFQSGALWKESIDGSDGRTKTSLRTEPIGGKRKTTAEVRYSDYGAHSELWVFEMGMRDLVEGLGFKRLGIRSSLKPSPHGGGLVELNPRVDDQSGEQERYTLDPRKNYWPIRYDSENRSHDGNVSKRRLIVAEFFSDPKTLYPKRVTLTYPGERKTTYYAALAAEFPETLGDDAFSVAIPDGVAVTDNVSRKTYKQGSGEATPFREPPTLGLWDAVKSLRAGDWLYYGAFFGATALFVIGSLYFFNRPRKPRQ